MAPSAKPATTSLAQWARTTIRVSERTSASARIIRRGPDGNVPATDANAPAGAANAPAGAAKTPPDPNSGQDKSGGGGKKRRSEGGQKQ